jgi:alginate O-acetyltransferase complex protein AlgI
MIFSSYSFLLIFFIFLPSYYLAKNNKAKLILTILFSIYFLSYYGYIHIIVVLFTAIISFFAIIIPNKYYLRFTILTLLLMLIAFKYHDFIGLDNLIHWFARETNYPIIEHYYNKIFLILPLGISFYTFQVIGALVDQKKLQWKILPSSWLAYVIFFPQLIAGPIVRIKTLILQFNDDHKLHRRNIIIGLQLFTIGFAKKTLLADPLSMSTADIWANPSNYNGLASIYAILAFYFQIYLDFSAYTDMGRGCARMMGYRLPINFRNPYFANTPIQFFERWHVSLSSWIRDYLFFPLTLNLSRFFGDKIGSNITVSISAFIAMFIFGVWHGAGWNFVIYGIGTAIMVAIWNPVNGLIDNNKKISKFFGFIWVQGLFIFSLVFFRATDVTSAMEILNQTTVSYGKTYPNSLIFLFLCFISTYLIQYLDQKSIENRSFAKIIFYLRNNILGLIFWSFIFICILFLKVYLDGGSEMISLIDDLDKPFIYFDF